MVEVFKTNVQKRRQAKILLSFLSRKLPSLRINFDLDDCDKILRVEGENICHQTIRELMTENGYNCEVLE
jgi:hypothetical protein